jgi:hypothetical protein
LPPITANAPEITAPGVYSPRLPELVMLSGANATVSVNAALALSPVTGSLTETVIGKVPPISGTPLIAPEAFAVRLEGNPTTDHE